MADKDQAFTAGDMCTATIGAGELKLFCCKLIGNKVDFFHMLALPDG